ncbi:MAG: hypothetical protein CVU08_15300, partial [Bacteroidetes bacterium HGW-Bacteroidetes-3]
LNFQIKFAIITCFVYSERENYELHKICFRVNIFFLSPFLQKRQKCRQNTIQFRLCPALKRWFTKRSPRLGFFSIKLSN